MKKFFAVALLIITLSSSALLTFAHPGRTDSKGGHYDHSTGEYHYHSGNYAGQGSSSSGNSSSSEEIIKDAWKERGLEDGLKQLCFDYLYLSAFDDAFDETVSEYSKNHPIFKILIKNNFRDILDHEINYLDEYESNRAAAFASYYWVDSYYNYYPIIKSTYFEYYDYSYRNASVDKALENYQHLAEAQQAESQGATDGSFQLNELSLPAYKKAHPIESYFALLTTFQVITICSILIFIILIIVKRIRKSIAKRKSLKSNNYVTSLKEEEITVIESETILEETTSHPSYESLIPKFIPPKQEKNDSINYNEVISFDSFDENKFKGRDFFIGDDIPEGIYYFTPIKETETSFFYSKDKCTHITKTKQKFFLMKGEKIRLFNCYLEPEE